MILHVYFSQSQELIMLKIGYSLVGFHSPEPLYIIQRGEHVFTPNGFEVEQLSVFSCCKHVCALILNVYVWILLKPLVLACIKVLF